jgi:diguanylate cyclase (GGDEF)-like protein/PAS domain S-box-containing protein
VEPVASTLVLPESDLRFRSAFADAAVGMAIIGSSGAFVYANQAFCRLCGFEEARLYGMTFAEALHPDDRAARLDVFQRIVAGEIGSFINEWRLLCQDRSVVWIRASITVPGACPGSSQVITFVEDITERKQAENALRTSEERFRIAAENASDIIYEWDLQTGAVDVFGESHQQLADWPVPRSYEAWKSMVHPDDFERLLSQSEHHLGNVQRFSNEYRVVGRSGKIYHYSNRGQAIRNGTGEPYKCIGLLTDITERRVAEEAISHLAAIVQCSEDAIVATDTSGAITTWNDGAHKLLGYTASQVRSMPFAALLESTDLARKILAHIQQGRSSRLDEALCLRSDGTHVPVLLSVSPIRKSSGQLTGSAIIASDLSARKQAEGEMAHRAMHDHLTGLPNRLLLAEGLARSIAGAELRSSGTAVIFLDLDRFKFVNDTLGHDAGDVLLQEVAQRLSRCIRQGDMLARMGGDEFMVVVNGVTGDQVATTVGDRLRDSLREPFFVAHHELVITASMGISMYPRDGNDVSALRRNADAAMYEAKQAGKDGVRFYKPALGAAFQARLEMETDLRHALDNDQLCLHYQPMFLAATQRLTAYEALARWPHPTLGFVPPSQFIPLAEETGLIIRLGEWVLREACRQCRWWQDHGKSLVRVAVNVSSLQFARDDFVDTVLGVLLDTGLEGDLLDLELTESIVMRDIDSVVQKMAKLRSYGVRISVDDFGTGYSSLGYLSKLPVDILKIDRCFIADIGENDTAVRLIQGMISLGHSIGKRVIVEGIETTAQLEILRDLRCDEVQGFLLGAPERLAGHDEQALEIPTEQLIA